MLTAIVALACTSRLLHAAEPTKAAGDGVALPKPADVQKFEVYPTKVALKGGDDAQQLILTATLEGNKLQDLTLDVKYEPADAKVVRVTPSGRVVPLGNGSTEVTVSYGDKVVKVPVTAEKIDENLPINFGNQITPIFTKLGCNGGGCHGKASGQGGFKLSLLGFEPEVDYMALVKEARGRRLFPAAPDHSLLLLKATGLMAHGGGKRMEVNSDEYKLIRRWIAAGSPVGLSTDPSVAKISIYPAQRIMARQGKQQFAVYAHYTDGTVEDITRRAQYESNEQEIAIVDAQGTVRTLDMSGEAAIMARYQGNVITFRATVPLGVKIPEYTFEHKTIVDQHTHNKWKQLGLVPSELCSDEVFVRRVSLDITGSLPTPAQVTAFLNDKDPAKREKLVDALLETPEYAYYFAGKWADILRNKRGNNQQSDRVQGTFGFHGWIREAIASDKPYDEFTRDIITANGDEVKNPAVMWYRTLFQDQAKFMPEFVDNMGQVFLGLRVSCAQCHHHPYEKWSQDDYWGLASFVARVGQKPIPMPGTNPQGNNRQRQFIYSRNIAMPAVRIPNTTRTATMKLLDGEPMVVPSDEDARHKLVDWMVDAKNPYFARAVANRYWAHFFGRGIVDPLDDMRITNPPSNPELLDALAKDLVDKKYSLKNTIRTICKSRTYQLSAVPNEFNKHDKQTYARYYPKRMGAEVLFDAVCQVTNSFTNFPGLPTDKHAPKRAIMLPDEAFQSYFLDVFGRPQRLSACECERVSEANLAQALHLLNSDEVQNKLAAGNGRADQLAKDARPHAEKIEEMFLWAFARKPTEKDMEVAMAHIKKHEKDVKIAYQDLLWTLINCKEFVFNK